MHSFRNPAHERRVGEILREEAPEISVSLSSEVAPEIREYERTSTTTIANVYTRPLVEGYLSSLEAAWGDSASTCHSTLCSRTAVRPV